MPSGRPLHAELYSRWDHQTGSAALLVYFNGYGNQAKGLQTRLDSFASLSLHATSTLWFAEAGDLSWYTDFDRRIQETIRFAAREHDVLRLLLIGSSAGAYAAIRHAALFHDADADLDSIRVIAVNPQSGFSTELLKTIRARMADAGWPAAALGTNPILPEPAASIPTTARSPATTCVTCSRCPAHAEDRPSSTSTTTQEPPSTPALPSRWARPPMFACIRR